MLDAVGYRCVHCLRWMDHVFKPNPPALVPCRACSNPKDAKVTSADGFFEFSNVLISLDLLLLRKDAFAHVVFNTRLGRRPLQMGVLALIGDAFRRWTSSELWNPERLESEKLTISTLYSIQSIFYAFLFSAFCHHLLNLALLVVVFKLRHGILLGHFVRAFLVSISVKVIFVPLLVWTAKEAFLPPFIFTELISIAFVAIQAELLAKVAAARTNGPKCRSKSMLPSIAFLVALVGILTHCIDPFIERNAKILFDIQAM